jgi:outer membrane protein TolC
VGESGERVSEANLESARLLVVGRVKKAYWKAAFSEMSVAHFLSILDTVKEYQKMAAIRFQAGQVTSVDVLRGRLEEVRVQNEIIEARRMLQEAKSALWLEMGVQAPADFPSLAAMSFAPFTKELDELKTEAADRPSLRALRQELKLRETVLQLASKDLYPDLRLGLFYPSLYTSGWGFELEISLPLWSQARRGGIREAEALRQREMIILDYAVMRVMNRLESAYAGVQAASEQLSLIETSLLNDAADLLSAGTINYQHGRIDSLDLLDNYRMHKESRLQHLRALLNYHLALVELETAGEEPAA